MTEPITNDEIHRTVYNHLYKMNEHLVSNVFSKITPELMAIMSQDAYCEMMQLSQQGLLKDYYNRLMRGAV